MSHFSRLKEELDSKQHELREQQAAIESKKEALVALESVINTAMHTKSGTQDIVKHVIEDAVRRDHMSGSDIVQTVLSTVMQINGRSRRDNLEDFFVDIITDNDSMEVAINSAIECSGDTKDAAKFAVETAIDCSLDEEEKKSIAKTMRDVLDEKAPNFESMRNIESPLKKNTLRPTARLPRAKLFDINDDLRRYCTPVIKSKKSYNRGD